MIHARWKIGHEKIVEKKQIINKRCGRSSIVVKLNVGMINSGSLFEDSSYSIAIMNQTDQSEVIYQSRQSEN